MLPVLTYTQPEAAGRRAALAPADARRRRGAGPRARPRRRRLPVAHDPGARVLGLLAGGHRRLPHQRRHRRRRRPLPRRHRRRRSSSATSRSTCWSATARLWRSLGHHDRDGRFRIDGVTGPDEYSAIADNNVYTNLMAQQNLRAAAAVADRHPDRADELRRRRRGDGVVAGRGRRDGHPLRRATSASTRRARASPTTRVWDFADTPPDKYPLLLHFPYFDLYRKQVVKQADLVLAMHLRGDAFTREQKDRELPLLRGAHGARLVAVGLHAGGGGGRGRPPRAGLRLPGRGRARWTSRTWPATPATACTWRRWRAPGPRWSTASAACGPSEGRL